MLGFLALFFGAILLIAWVIDRRRRSKASFYTDERAGSEGAAQGLSSEQVAGLFTKIKKG